MATAAGRGVVLAGAVAVLAAGCDLGTAAVVHSSPSRVLEVVDVDGDGSLDVVAAGPGSYQVLVNDGTGSLAGSPVATDADIAAFAFGDLDGDGAIDRVDVTHTPSGSTSLLVARGDGAGGFGAQEVAVADTDPSGVAADVDVFDLDGDGDQDVALGGRVGVHVFVNDGTGALASRGVEWGICGGQSSGGGETMVVSELTHADLDRDGDDDVVATGFCESPTGPRPGVWLFVNDGTGAFPSSVATVRHVGGAAAFVGLSVADIDEDGHLDVVRGDPSASSVIVVRGNGAGGMAAGGYSVATPAPPGDLEVADIDADGHLDLVVTAAGTGIARVLYGTGTGTFPETHAVATGGDVVGPVGVGPIDGDGSVDLVFGNDGETADPSVAVLFNTRDGRQH